MRVIINGALGRMGQAVQARLAELGHEAAALVDIAYQAGEGIASLAQCHADADVLIDFSSPKALDDLLCYCISKKLPLVLASTGYTDADMAKIDDAAKKVAVFKSANMSLGINLLKSLIVKAAQTLGDDFDVEIIETHHNQKKDSPSGTALLLYDAIKDAYDVKKEAVFGRGGNEAKREACEIGIHAVRGGTVPGIHEVGFYGHNETLSLIHSAQSREVFAIGAVKAAEYLVSDGVGSRPGLYSMEDLIGQ